MDDLRVRKASELLGNILSPAVAAKADQWSRLFGFWRRAAGDALAAHSHIVDLRNGIVFVETDHPGWIQLLQLEQNRILLMIRSSFPELEVSGIAFKLAKDGSLPGTIRSSAGRVPPDVLPSAKAEQAERPGADLKMPTVKETLEAVADDDFRGILSSLAKTLKEANKEAPKKEPRQDDSRQ